MMCQKVTDIAFFPVGLSEFNVFHAMEEALNTCYTAVPACHRDFFLRLLAFGRRFDQIRRHLNISNNIVKISDIIK